MSTSSGVGSNPVFSPSSSTSENSVNSDGSTTCVITLEGIAARQKDGPQIGRYDIYEGETEYMFCMSLPGVDLNSGTFSCIVKPVGEITVKGRTTTGPPSEHEIQSMLINGLPDSGPFAVSFNVPGPVKAETLKVYSSNDGLLWGVIKKQ